MEYKAPFGATDPNASYINGDPAAGVEGSIPPAPAIEDPQREIVKVVEQLGLTPSGADLTQLWQAIQKVYGRTCAGDPNGNVAADVIYERCWDESTVTPQLWIATAADGTLGGTVWEKSLVSRVEFGQSIGGAGYQKLPGGLIFQWGYFATDGSTGIAITFPIVFPSETIGVWFGELSGPVPNPIALNSKTTSGFTVGDTSPTQSYNWFSLGF